MGKSYLNELSTPKTTLGGERYGRMQKKEDKECHEGIPPGSEVNLGCLKKVDEQKFL